MIHAITHKTGLLAVLLMLTGWCYAQTGKVSFDTKLLRNASCEMVCYAETGGGLTEISTFSYNTAIDNKTFAIYTTLVTVGGRDRWVDTSIVDAGSLKPVYRSSYNRKRNLVLRYGKEVTGYYLDNSNGEKTVVKDQVNATVLDDYAYPYLLGLLPLTSGYSTSLDVYSFKPENSSHVKQARVEEVKSNIYTSKLTGTHKVWQVSVLEESTGERYVYYLDKDTRRIWKVDIYNQGQHLVMLDKEIDFNPVKSSFDKVAVMKSLKNGSAVITGQVFARDNQNEGMLSGIAVLNINKKQFAREGTTIVLIPYTDYFKEWYKLNEASRKKGRSIPLSADVAACIATTTVYDDKGHFEFVNLMPGEYMLYTEFGYIHTSNRTEVVGYTDTYINGLFQGSRTNTVSTSYDSNAAASVKKIVSIDKEGEKVEVKLKKTL
ncbi:hypothetical protein ECE50_005510 [Chitinophaga sp. Mgbs1]|uniref:Uncharacterized protein n=1 Tax=Chitinophaga solisilvae TaxID=1233460 RepID=A0A3S1JIF9_9BACT|nr:hypothetical protein [Chitinophaga solisilvae]